MTHQFTPDLAAKDAFSELDRIQSNPGVGLDTAVSMMHTLNAHMASLMNGGAARFTPTHFGSVARRSPNSVR